MSWNQGSELRKHEAAAARMAEEYRAAGMTEEQIAQMAAFDREVLRSDRRFYRHIQQLAPDGRPEDGPEPASDGSEPPLTARMDWLEEIESPALLEVLRTAPPQLLEILTLYVFEGCNQKEIARYLCCSRQNVNEQLRHFRCRVRKRRK